MGKLEISDDTNAKPAEVKDLMFETKQETQETLTEKLFWNVDAEGTARKEQGLVYNDEGAYVEGKVIRLENVSEAWGYGVDGKFIQYVQGETAINAQNFVPGTYLVRMRHNNVIRTDKVVVE